MELLIFFIVIVIVISLKLVVKTPVNSTIVSLSKTNFYVSPFFIPEKLDADSVKILEKYSNYYRMLSAKQKKLFNYRVVKFLKYKEFIIKDSLVLTDTIQLLIAESALKLTAGLSYFTFADFEKLILFKGEFYSDVTKKWEKGETNLRGALVFSWKDFLDGDLNEEDNLNLGLHEFAHALMAQSIQPNMDSDAHFDSFITEYEDTLDAPGCFEKIKASHLFRNYAFRNKMEFFAVAVEHFFETPAEFRKVQPELYSLISRMLNQDTAAMYEQGSQPNAATDFSAGQSAILQ